MRAAGVGGQGWGGDWSVKQSQIPWQLVREREAKHWPAQGFPLAAPRMRVDEYAGRGRGHAMPRMCCFWVHALEVITITQTAYATVMLPFEYREAKAKQRRRAPPPPFAQIFPLLFGADQPRRATKGREADEPAASPGSVPSLFKAAGAGVRKRDVAGGVALPAAAAGPGAAVSGSSCCLV